MMSNFLVLSRLLDFLHYGLGVRFFSLAIGATLAMLFIGKLTSMSTLLWRENTLIFYNMD
jgi:hypothetical protein